MTQDIIQSPCYPVDDVGSIKTNSKLKSGWMTEAGVLAEEAEPRAWKFGCSSGEDPAEPV